MTDARFTKATQQTVDESLATELIDVADDMRDLYTEFGVRRYVVRRLMIRWSGERRGEGSQFVELSEEILPTPKVLDLETLTEVVNPAGVDEIGTIVLTQISGRYTEEQLRGVTARGEDLDLNQDFFYEIEFILANGKDTFRRRFFPRGVPTYVPEQLQWQVRLERQRDDRLPNGDPS